MKAGLLKKRQIIMGTKVKKEVAYDEILKRFEYTVWEYIRFYDFYRNQDISSENTDAFYIMLQTKLMVLRKYDYKNKMMQDI